MAATVRPKPLQVARAGLPATPCATGTGGQAGYLSRRPSGSMPRSRSRAARAACGDKESPPVQVFVPAAPWPGEQRMLGGGGCGRQKPWPISQFTCLGSACTAANWHIPAGIPSCPAAHAPLIRSPPWPPSTSTGRDDPPRSILRVQVRTSPQRGILPYSGHQGIPDFEIANENSGEQVMRRMAERGAVTR